MNNKTKIMTPKMASAHHFRPYIQGVERLAKIYKRERPDLHWVEWNILLERTKQNTRRVSLKSNQDINFIFEDILDGFLIIEFSKVTEKEKEKLRKTLGQNFGTHLEKDSEPRPFINDEGKIEKIVEEYYALHDEGYLKLLQLAL